MRGLRSTIVLIVVLAGLGAYIYFYLMKQPEKSESSGPPKQKVFATLSADKIDELKIRSASGDVTTLKRGTDGWQITDPIQAKADESEVSGITSNLTTVETQRVVEENPSSLKDFGLDPPHADVAFKTVGEKDYRHLLVGDKTTTSVDMYAKTGTDKRVILIPSFTDGTFNRSTFDLRDKTALKFDRDKVDGIVVTADGKTLQLAKDGGDWKITKPIQVPADFGSVEGLIGRLQTLQMKSIATNDASPDDLKKDGLDKPQASATLVTGSARATIDIGGASDDALYAKDASKPTVMTVEKAILDDLKKGADDYRRKDVFAFRAFNATRFEITRDGNTVVFEKAKTGTGANAPEQWKRVSPNPGNVDKDKMDAMLTRWANMRAASFVESTAKTGLDKPAAVVVVRFEDGKNEERVTFGKADNDVYAARPGEPGAAKIDATDFDMAFKGVDEIAK